MSESTAQFARPVQEDLQAVNDDTHNPPAGTISEPVGRHRIVNSAIGVWIGLALAGAGFGAIFFSWTKVAGLANVAEQVPYVISGGFTGLGLIIVGATVVDVAVRRQDGRDRHQQLTEITRLIAEIRDDLEEDRWYRANSAGQEE